MTFSRVIMCVSGVLFLVVGLAFLIDPVRWAASVEISIPTPLAKTDFRALYGGLDFGNGLCALCCCLVFCLRC